VKIPAVGKSNPKQIFEQFEIAATIYLPYKVEKYIKTVAKINR